VVGPDGPGAEPDDYTGGVSAVSIESARRLRLSLLAPHVRSHTDASLRPFRPATPDSRRNCGYCGKRRIHGRRTCG